MMPRLRRLGAMAVSPTLRYLPLALLTALRVEWGLRTRGVDVLAGSLGVPLTMAGRSANDPPLTLIGPWQLGQPDTARYLAAKHLIRIWPCGGQAKCLRTALVAGSLLRGRQPTLHIGISSGERTDRAHAWICIDNQVLDPAVAYFAPFVAVSSQA